MCVRKYNYPYSGCLVSHALTTSFHNISLTFFYRKKVTKTHHAWKIQTNHSSQIYCSISNPSEFDFVEPFGVHTMRGRAYTLGYRCFDSKLIQSNSTVGRRPRMVRTLRNLALVVRSALCGQVNWRLASVVIFTHFVREIGFASVLLLSFLCMVDKEK